MCLTRLIAAGIGTVKFVAQDQSGAMSQFLLNLSGNWHSLAKSQSFRQAEASPSLRQLAYDIFALTLPDSRSKLFRRRGRPVIGSRSDPPSN